MKRFLVILALVGLFCAILTMCVEAARESRTTQSPEPELVGDPAAAAILGRSCQDCHSDRTRWPWYSHLPGVGSMLRNDVQTAHRHMNLSRWRQYSTEDKERILKEIAAEVRSSQMPPERYLILHPGARLSASDVSALTRWAVSERHRLAAPEQAGSK